jgi:NAD(P)H-dependent flavin oxidoreductase YrpB (nitropropane dioxygenase family)
MVAMTNFADMVSTAIKEGADIIFSGAGLPLNLPSFLTEGAKTKLAPIVSSARAAKLLCEKWWNEYNYTPDAIVVEGPKAGGHLGYKADQINDEQYSLETILPQVVETVHKWADEHNCEIPVIAAGGIYTGEDIYNIMELGASGVQMGTRFVTTEECDANIGFKQAYIDAKEEDIEIIQSPVGMPGRAVHSSFLASVKEGLKKPKQCAFNCIRTCDVVNSPYCIMLALFNAFKGHLDKGYAFAGANAWRAEKIESVKNVVNKLVEEFRTVKAKVLK